MKYTRKIKETDRLLLFRNLQEEEILVIKINKDDNIHKDTHCTYCNGHSYQYYFVPRQKEPIVYCNLCFTWYKKDIDWETIYYTPVFNQIIKFVKDNITLFNEEDLNLIDHYFELKTTKHIKIRNYLCKEDTNVYNN